MRRSNRIAAMTAACAVLWALAPVAPAAPAAEGKAGDLDAQAQQTAAEQLAAFGKGYRARVDGSRRVVFVSALDDRHLDKTLQLLTAFTDAFRRTLGASEPAWNVTVVLPIVDDFNRLQKPFPDCVGFYDPRTRRLVSIDRGRTLLHEFTHALHHADAAAAGQSHPLWVTEGLATLFETSRITPSGLEPETDGRLLSVRKAVFNKKPIPLKDLLTMGPQAFMKDAALAYAEARYLMHYLHHRDRLADFYKRFKATCGSDPAGVKALEAALGSRLYVLEPAWHQWVLSLRMPMAEDRSQDARLGLQVQNDARGVKVVGVVPGSAAQLAGRIRVGDVIAKFNGREVTNPVEYIAAVRDAGAMQTVKVELFRHGRPMTVIQPLGATSAH